MIHKTQILAGLPGQRHTPIAAVYTCSDTPLSLSRALACFSPDRSNIRPRRFHAEVYDQQLLSAVLLYRAEPSARVYIFTNGRWTLL